MGGRAWISQAFRRYRVAAAALALLIAVPVRNHTTLVGRQATFEVASVRHIAGERTPPFFVRVRGGRFEARSSLREVIRFAYEQDASVRIDGPMLLDELFDIQAKPFGDSEPALAEIRAMTRTMLAERFRLTLASSAERRTVSVLRRIKPDGLGPNLRPFNGQCTPRPTGIRTSDPAFLDASRTSCTLQVYNGRIRGTAEMAELARFFTLQLQAATFSTDEVVLDGTELNGRFQVEMDFDPRTRAVGGLSSGDLPSFDDALKRQLGLNIEREARSVPTLVVQRAEMPTPN